MSVSDTAGMIRAIDSMTVETCDATCWCTLGRNGDNHNRMRWMPGDPIVRFPLERKAA
jgi:hypothetical protein